MSGLKYDVILRGGLIVDGTGAPPFRADIGIRGDKIATVGNINREPSYKEIDVSGLVVAPGFIDVHTHDDAALISAPQMLPKLTQGVTTVIAGNCGMSGAPYSRPVGPLDVLHLVFKDNQAIAGSLGEYLRKVVVAAPAVNAAFLIGHTTLRMQVMGNDLLRAATPAEVAEMRGLLKASLEQGAIGMSTGLFYPAAHSAPTEEVIEIARALTPFGGLYVTHMRDEADCILESIREALRIGREVGSEVIISHHKCIGSKNFGRSVETLALLEEMQLHQRVSWDVYPYIAGSSLLNIDLVRQSSRTSIAWSDPHPEFAGLDLAAVVRAWDCRLEEAVARLQPAGAIYFMMDERDLTRILVSADAMIGSDGLPSDIHPHPRLWGTFPRVIKRYVRERRVLTLENAIHKMTGLSAERFKLHKRGQLTDGFFADITVFDADTISDDATFECPICPAQGIRYVLVNGQLALADGAPVSKRSGRVLRRH